MVADNRWATSTGTIRGAGSTRSGWTGANMSVNAGIVWRWQRIDGIVPYAFSWVALRASTGNTPPSVNTPTATNIGQTSATLGGNLGSTGGSPITARGVVYCQCADPVIGGAGVTTVSAPLSQNTGPFAVGVSGLTAARTYTFRAYATNALGTGYSATATFDTLNTPPTANAGGPYTAAEGSTLTLSGSGTDADGDALTYSWDVNGDGTYGDATGASPALNRAAREALGINDGPATFNVRLRVSDGRDTTTSAATILNVPNAVPDATVTNGGPVNEGSTGTVSFTNVTDGSDADTAAGFRYAYDFNNDGTYEVGGPTYAGAVTASSATVPASFLADGPGTRTVGMLVLDKDGVGHGYTTTITINNVAPTGTLPDLTGNEGQQQVIGLLNVSDAGNDPVRFVYDVNGNGTDDTAGVAYANATTATTSSVPAADGPSARLVRVRVIDEDGGSNVYTATVTVLNVAPTGALADQTIAEGQTATFGLTNVADPGDLATLRYVYDFDGNGTDDTAGVTYANAATASSQPTPAGDGPATRTVRVRVIDKDGASNVYTATLTVTNVAPTGSLADRTVDEGTAVSVGLTNVADPADLASVRYAYDVDGNATDDTAAATYAGGSTATTAAVPANLTANGPAAVTVRVRVLDKDGASTAYTATSRSTTSPRPRRSPMSRPRRARPRRSPSPAPTTRPQPTRPPVSRSSGMPTATAPSRPAATPSRSPPPTARPPRRSRARSWTATAAATSTRPP